MSDDKEDIRLSLILEKKNSTTSLPRSRLCSQNLSFLPVFFKGLLFFYKNISAIGYVRTLSTLFKVLVHQEVFSLLHTYNNNLKCFLKQYDLVSIIARNNRTYRTVLKAHQYLHSFVTKSAKDFLQTCILVALVTHTLL